MRQRRHETSEIELPIKPETVILFKSEKQDTFVDGTAWVRSLKGMRTTISEDFTGLNDDHTQWEPVLEEVELELELENTPEANTYFRTWKGATPTSFLGRTIEYCPDGKEAEDSKLTFTHCVVGEISYDNSSIFVCLYS